MAINLGNGTITFDDTIQSTAYVPRTITKIVKGYNNFNALTSDGKIYSWGYNVWGGIGDGMTTTALPTEIQLKGTDRNNISGCPFSYTPTDLVSICDSKYVLCENAARTDGVLLAWGGNSYGQLGIGNTTQQNYPRLTVGTSVSKMYYPDNHHDFNSTTYPYVVAYMKKTDGTFWCVGYNGLGQLANGTVTNSSTWIALTPPTGKTISNIWVGSSTNSCTFCKTTDNLIYAVGGNITGALGLGNTTQQNSWVQVTYFNAITDVIDIQTGDYDGGDNMWTAVFTASGNIYTCGNNAYGQLGDGTLTTRSTFAQVSLTKPVRKMIRGSTSIYVIFTDNTYARWGENTYGQLGVNNTTNQPTPIYSSNVFQKPNDIYSLIASGSNCTLSRDIITSPVGSTPLKMIQTGNDPFTISYGGAASRLYPARVGQTWTMSVWVKASAATTIEGAWIAEQDRDGNYVTGAQYTGGGGLNVAIDTNWVQLTTTWTTASAAVAFIAVRLDGTNVGGSGITVWWDGLRIDGNIQVSDIWSTSGVNGSHQTNVFILDTAGILYGCGRNNTGSLGLGHATLNVSMPTRIPFPKTDVADVLGTAANDTTCIRCTTGDKVYVCGYNGNNELGSYPNNTRYRFKQLTLG